MPAIDNVLGRIYEYVLGPIQMVIFAAGFFLFIWGLVQFLWVVGEGGEQTEGKQHMLWGIVGMFLMISVWGVIALIDGTFNLGALNSNGAATDPGRIPAINFGSSN